MKQLNLFQDNETERAPTPSPVGQLIIFPLVHHRSLLQRLAGKLRSIRDPGERDQFFEDRLQALYRSRLADGLSRAEARADVEAFANDLRAEYRVPSRLPVKHPESRVIPLFPRNRPVDNQTLTAAAYQNSPAQGTA